MEDITRDNQFYFIIGAIVGIIIQIFAAGIGEIAWYFTEYRKIKARKRLEKIANERSRNNDADPHDR